MVGIASLVVWDWRWSDVGHWGNASDWHKGNCVFLVLKWRCGLGELTPSNTERSKYQGYNDAIDVGASSRRFGDTTNCGGYELQSELNQFILQVI